MKFKTLLLLPKRAPARIDIDEPRLMKSKTLMALPKRPNARTEMLEPILVRSKIDTLPLKRPMSCLTDSALPNLTNPLTDRLLPNEANCIIDREDPIFAIDLTLMVEPKLMKSSTDPLWQMLATPRTEVALPKLAKPLKLNADPNLL
jgi:hypothetical protein